MKRNRVELAALLIGAMAVINAAHAADNMAKGTLGVIRWNHL